jgi:hypothetical protein
MNRAFPFILSAAMSVALAAAPVVDFAQEKPRKLTRGAFLDPAEAARQVEIGPAGLTVHIDRARQDPEQTWFSVSVTGGRDVDWNGRRVSLFVRLSDPSPVRRDIAIDCHDRDTETFKFKPISALTLADGVTRLDYHFTETGTSCKPWGKKANGKIDGALRIGGVLPAFSGPHAAGDITFIRLAAAEEERTAATVEAFDEIDPKRAFPGPKPFTGPDAILLKMPQPGAGVAQIVIQDESNEEYIRLRAKLVDGAATFVTNLPHANRYQLRQAFFWPKGQKGTLPITNAVFTACTHTTQAGALRLDVDTRNPLHISRCDDERPVLVLANAARVPIAAKGVLHLRDFAGKGPDVPVDVSVPGDGAARVDVPWPLPSKGIWFVSGELRAADGSTARLGTRFAVLDRHEVGPILPKPKFRMGINYHAARFAPKDFALTLDALVACGCKLVRTGGFHFGSTETNENAFAWETPDRILRALRARGISIDANLYTVPRWARKPGYEAVLKHRRVASIPPRDGLFRDYCRAVAARYGTQVDYYEMGNEWDLVPPEVLPIPEALRVQREGWEGVKAGCPDACVIPNGWTVPDSGSWNGRPPTNPGINEAFAEQAQGWYDVHPVHLHGPFESYERTLQRRLFPFFKRYGITKPWYSNETALTTVGGMEDVAARTVWKKILYAWAWGSTDYIWYNLRATGWRVSDPEQAYGLITADYYPRATYCAFSALSALLEGFDRDTRLIDEKTRHVFRFRKGSEIVVAGWDAGLGGTAAIPFRTDAARVETCDLMGNRTACALQGGAVTWALGVEPSAIRFVGTTYAEPDAAALASVPLPVRRVQAIPADTPGRAPDFVLDDYRNMNDYYKADPAQVARCWKGVDDLSAKVWLACADGALRVRVEVTDDVHAPGDAVEVEVQTAAGVVRKPLSAPVRVGNVTRYACLFPLADLKITPQEVKSGFGFSILLHEDDGQGPDGVMTLPAATVVKE